MCDSAHPNVTYGLPILTTMSPNIQQTRRLISRALENVTAKREHLNELDRGLRDGDHGTTIARDARAAIDVLRDTDPSSVNEVFTLAGRAIMKSMGGASGVLLACFSKERSLS